MLKFFFMFLITIAAANVGDLTSDTTTGNLMVELINFESDEGNVRIHIYSVNEKDYFPRVSDKCLSLKVSKIINRKAEVVFKALPFGDYALTVHHDRNLNVKLDLNWLGLPSEGWGLSQNIIPIFSLPSFEDCKFKFDSTNQSIKIIVRN